MLYWERSVCELLLLCEKVRIGTGVCEPLGVLGRDPFHSRPLNGAAMALESILKGAGDWLREPGGERAGIGRVGSFKLACEPLLCCPSLGTSREPRRLPGRLGVVEPERECDFMLPRPGRRVPIAGDTGREHG